MGDRRLRAYGDVNTAKAVALAYIGGLTGQNKSAESVRIIKVLVSEIERLEGAQSVQSELGCGTADARQFARGLVWSLELERRRWATLMLKLSDALDEEREDYTRDKLRELTE